MIEYVNIPSNGLLNLTFGLIFLLTGLAPLILEMVPSTRNLVKFDSGGIAAIIVFVTSILIGTSLILLSFMAFREEPITETFDNPMSITDEYMENEWGRYTYFNLDEEALSETIREAVDADKAVINLDSFIRRGSDGEIRGDLFVESAREGEVFEFYVLKNGSKVNGYFFYEENKMIMVTETPSEVGDRVEVPLD